MQIKKTSKVVAAVVGFTLALTAFVAVGASAKVEAQSMTLSQLVDLFISLGIISPDKAAAAKAAVTSAAPAVSFTKDLTVGSTGADVTALQNVIGVTPATGYFGSITKAAVVKYQAANGVPSTGYVGPLTRAILNKAVAPSTTTTTTTTSTTTAPVTTTVAPVINTGVEGTLTVDKTSVSDSTVREGDTMKPVLGLKVQAKVSDINIQRVKLDLGANTSIYTKVYKTLYLVDDSGKVLAQSDLNSNTVVKDNGEYYLTLGGFSYLAQKDTTVYLWIKADVYSSIKAATGTNDCSGSGTGCVISLAGAANSAANAVRGVDGAGIDQYAGDSAISQSMSVESTLADSATLTISTSAVNYKTAEVVASGGSNSNELDQLPVLAVDLRADKDTVSITDIAVTLTNNHGVSDATTTRAYLYNGSTLLDTEDVLTSGTNAGKAMFTSSDQLVSIPAGTTDTLTVKVDVRSADTTATTISAKIATATDVKAQNSQSSTVTPTGSATGENFIVRNIGPVFTLVGAPTVSKTSSPLQNNYSTSTMTATFNVQVQAVGGDIIFGDNASTTGGTNIGMFGTTSSSFTVYQNGALATSLSSNATSTSYSVPSSGVVIDTPNHSFTLQQNNTVTIPVSYTIEGRTAAGIAFQTGNYSVQMAGIAWTNTKTGPQTSSFMNGKTDWQSPTVTLP